VFATISPDVLEWVIGGKADTNAAMTAMLTQISSSLKDLGKKDTSSDSMMPMMMAMMMMGKGGGGGAQVAAAPPPPPSGPPPGGLVNVEVNGRRFA
jgi:hypothetical protein